MRFPLPSLRTLCAAAILAAGTFTLAIPAAQADWNGRGGSWHGGGGGWRGGGWNGGWRGGGWNGGWRGGGWNGGWGWRGGPGCCWQGGVFVGVVPPVYVPPPVYYPPPPVYYPYYPQPYAYGWRGY